MPGGRPRTPTLVRFRKYVHEGRTEECWPWLGSRDSDGYGRIRDFVNGRYLFRRATHIAYETAKGPIPKGMWVLHSCDNPSCLNPHHLFLGTVKDNALDMIAKGRNTCGLRGDQHWKAKTRMLTIQGECHSIAGWAFIVGIRRKTLKDRLDKGWLPELAILIPVRHWHHAAKAKLVSGEAKDEQGTVHQRQG